MSDADHVHDLLARAENDFARRTVISRAYYCAYPVVTAYAVSLGFFPSGRGSDHSGVVAHLAMLSAGRAPATVARRLRDLHKLRKLADYDRRQTLAASVAEDAVNMMDEILEAIAAAQVAGRR